jgi:hypothetical protein
MGCGLLSSLQPAFPELRGYGLAIKRGATRDPTIPTANGMAGFHETARLNGGTYQIWPGGMWSKSSTRASAVQAFNPCAPYPAPT